MKNVALMAIVLIAIATIFSFSAVSADKPTDLPAYDEPICDVCGKLNTLIAAIPTETLTAINNTVNSLKIMVEGLQADVTGLRTNVTVIDDKIDAMQSDLDSIQDSLDDIAPGSSEFVVYDTTEIGVGSGEAIVVEAFAPFLSYGSEVEAEIPIIVYEKLYDGSDPYYVTHHPSGDAGIITLNYTHMAFTGIIDDDGSYIIRIKVPYQVKDDIIPKVMHINSGIITEYLPGDFKIHYE